VFNLKYFTIMNNVREYSLESDQRARSVVPLNKETIPVPNRRSGTYAWTLLLILISSVSTGAVAFVFIEHVLEASEACAYLLSTLFTCLMMAGLDQLYLSTARQCSRS
jgi:hypothetical protein